MNANLLLHNAQEIWTKRVSASLLSAVMSQIVPDDLYGNSWPISVGKRPSLTRLVHSAMNIDSILWCTWPY